MAALNRLWRVLQWLDRHPWVTSLALIVAVAAPGYFRVEGIAGDANRIAQRVEDQQAEIGRSRVEVCVQSRQDTRLAIVETVRYTAQFFTNAEEVRAIADGLEPVLAEILPDDFCHTINGPDP